MTKTQFLLNAVAFVVAWLLLPFLLLRRAKEGL